jgi:glycogen operon protein
MKYKKSEWNSKEGAPHPMGVYFLQDENAYNFAIYSRRAKGVQLLLYSDDDYVNPFHQYEFDPLINKSGRIWHCRLPASIVKGAQYYAYRVDGPLEAHEGTIFHPDKILLDPYARGIFFPPSFDREAAIDPGPNHGKAALGIIDGHRPPRFPESRPIGHDHDAIIYELHVKGFTRHPSSGVSPDKRGTFAGLVEKIPYLKDLGVTIIELLPIFQFDPQEGNYWGYMPMSFFAIHSQYCSKSDFPDQLDEFRQMVAALNEADMEVVLDVVYNHTAEEDERGPVYSFKGIDNDNYYLMDETGEYMDLAGTGNVLKTNDSNVRSLILDSLRYWALDMGVDGFRFDLASILTRKSDGSVDWEDPPIISAIRSDPALVDRRLIAEAWDISTYQVGHCFPGVQWSQWNGQYRDRIRSFVKSDPGGVRELMERIYGSADLFPDEPPYSYHPYQSINYVNSHDGFCLYDTVSYNEKHNEANGNNNNDGPDENYSWNCGVEGDEGVTPEIMALRKKQIKNFFTLLMLSNGTPMFCAGDEFMNTQYGNNNPYNQDNETTWLNWDLLEKNRDMYRFFKMMIAFRKAHPSIARSRFWRDDVTWRGTGSEPDLSYESRSLAFHLDGSDQDDSDLYVMINAYWETLTFEIVDEPGNTWRRVIDTSLESPDDIVDDQNASLIVTNTVKIKPRSVVVLISD